MAYRAKYPTHMSIRLSEEQKELLEAIADREEVSVGSIIRDAVDAGLKARKSTGAP